MTTDQFTELIEFLGRKFDAIDRRFDAIEGRLSAVERRLAVLEVSHEAMRDDIRALAEGQAVINTQLDRLEARVDALEEHFDRFEIETRARFHGIETRFDRFEVDFGTVILDHGRRIRAMEGSGGS